MFKFLNTLWGRLGFLPFLDKLEPMPKNLLQEALDKETLRLGRIIAVTVIVYYGLFVFSYSFSLPSAAKQILTISHTISIVLLVIFLVVTYTPFAMRHAMLLSVLASLIPLTNILHRFYILQDPVVTVSLIIGLLILSAVALNSGWLAWIIVYSFIGWIFVSTKLGLAFDFTMAYYAVALVLSCIAAFTICQMRCRTIRTYNNLMWHERIQSQELEKAQESLKTQNKELARVDELKTAFLGNMSHEFRTPLTAITGFTEILQSENFGPLNERQRNYLDNVAVSGNQLLDLVNNVLTLSSFDANKVALNLSESPIEPVIQSALNTLKQDLDAKQIDVKLSLDTELSANFDSALINQVMFNLLSNAIKFSEANSAIEVKAYEKDHAIFVEVIDIGIGIAEEDHALLFIPFSQVDGSLNRSHEGAGLGLALCKKIVEQHGGSVFVRSSLDQGSTFGFSLPKDLPKTLIANNR